MKKKLQKFLILMLSAAVLISATAISATATTYPADQGFREAAELQNLGLLKGVNDNGDLAVEKQLTRAEALTVIQRIANIPIKENIIASDFNDIKGHWAEQTIESFYSLGYVNGTSSTSFTPNRNVTGAEFVKMLLSAMGYENLTPDSAYAKSIELGILAGFGITPQQQAEPGTTAGLDKDNLTRGQAALIASYALFTEQENGKVLYTKLIDDGLFADKSAFDSLYALINDKPVTEKITFADSVNNYMPNDTNYMFSPYSLKTTLAMQANGAVGNTRTEILKVLGIKDLDNFNKQAQETMRVFSEAQIADLETANSLWTNTDFPNSAFQTDFTAKMQKYYNAEIGTVTNEDIVEKVNGWISQKTHEKINKILNEDARNNIEYQNLLVNAVYFKGGWANTFNPRLTAADTFSNADGTAVSADFMQEKDYYSYGEYNGIQIVKIPYAKVSYNEAEDTIIRDSGVDFNMYILLGNQPIEAPEQILNNTQLKSSYVQLLLPKFKVQYENDMVNIFRDLGLVKTTTFGEADLSNMLQDSKNKALTHILHKTYIAIDEKGTEAAAVTVASEGAGSPELPQPVIMKADHPFTYIIRDDVSGEILFMGQINNLGK
ncbi:MAG: serpin family protein [Bacillota bacterium]|jgi:serine protease inhibitor